MRHVLAALTTFACASTALLAPMTASAAPPTELCDGRVATIVASADGGPVVGTPGDDVIVGTDRNDVLDGRGGNDTICGLTGADTLIGGEGGDRLLGGLDSIADYRGDEDLGDRIIPGPGDDHVDVGADPAFGDGYRDRISFRDSVAPVTVDLAAGIATGEGTDTIVPVPLTPGIEGSMHDDHLAGSEGPDWIMGGAGDDTILAGGGDDRLEPDAFDGVGPGLWGDGPTYPGDDTVDSGAGDDWIIGGHGADVLLGGAGDDGFEIAAGAGGRVEGGPGKDHFSSPEWVVDQTPGGSEGDYSPSMGRVLLVGGPGKDTFMPVVGGAEWVVVRGGPGRDVVELDLGKKELAPHLGKKSRALRFDVAAGRSRFGNGGVLRFAQTEKYEIDDDVWPRRPRLTVRGSNRAEVIDLSGWSGPVRVLARGGADRVTGGMGGDRLDGGPGRDRLDGERGRDRCVRGEVLRRCER